MNAEKIGLLADLALMAILAIAGGVSLFYAVTGLAWVILAPELFQFYALVLSFITMVVAGAVFSNSLIYYSQVKNVRRLVILLLAGDVIILTLLYVITHPVNIQWAPVIADRIRNRTITTTFGLAAMPGALMCSIARDSPAGIRTQVAYAIWGGVVIPLIGILCVFSPQPLFTLTDPVGGIGGLTLAGWVVAIAMPLIALISLVRFIVEYKKSRNRVALAFGFALVLWIIASLFLSFLWDPIQVAELIYMLNVLAGMGVIGLAMLVDAVIQPFKTLETQIEKRTEELDKSKKESDLFLMAWSHKVGNILQGITTFLDVYSEDASESTPSSGRSIASELSWEGGIINRQVSWLAEVRLSTGKQLEAVDIEQAVETAIDAIDELKGYSSIKFNWNGPSHSALADDSLDLLFTGLFSHLLLSRRNAHSEISIRSDLGEGCLYVSLTSDKKAFDSEMADFLRGRNLPDLVNMDLDLYMTRLLLERYNTTVDWQDATRRTMILTFQCP